MLLFATLAHGTVCSAPYELPRLVTPSVVPTNAEFVIAYMYWEVPEVDLVDAYGRRVPHEVDESDGRVVLTPLDLLDSDGDYVLRIDDGQVPITVDAVEDLEAPAVPEVVQITDSGRRDDDVPRFSLQLRSLPEDTFAEIQLQPASGDPLVVFATGSVDFGWTSCEATFPLGYRSGEAYDIRLRSVDAAGNTSAWLEVPTFSTDPTAAPGARAGGCGCSAIEPPPHWGWLGRRRSRAR